MSSWVKNHICFYKVVQKFLPTKSSSHGNVRFFGASRHNAENTYFRAKILEYWKCLLRLPLQSLIKIPIIHFLLFKIIYEMLFPNSGLVLRNQMFVVIFGYPIIANFFIAFQTELFIKYYWPFFTRKWDKILLEIFPKIIPKISSYSYIRYITKNIWSSRSVCKD